MNREWAEFLAEQFLNVNGQYMSSTRQEMPGRAGNLPGCLLRVFRPDELTGQNVGSDSFNLHRGSPRPEVRAGIGKSIVELPIIAGQM